MSSRTRTRGISPAEYARLITAPATIDPGALARDRAASALQPPVRLALADTPHSGPLDGGWWPRSRDLTAELGPLVTAVGVAHQTTVIHLTYDRRAWAPTGRRVAVGQRRVKVGWFELTEPQQVNLTLLSGRTITLLAIPPETEPDTARWLLDRAADPGNTLQSSELLAAARPSPAATGRSAATGFPATTEVPETPGAAPAPVATPLPA